MSFEGEVRAAVSQVGIVLHSLGHESEGVFPNVLLDAGNQQLHRRAVRANQPSLVLHKQAF